MADALIAILTSGLILGSLYSLIASGMSLIWSPLGAFDFTHGAPMAPVRTSPAPSPGP